MRSIFLKQQLEALVRQCDLSLFFGCGMLGANLLLALVVFGTSARVVVVPPDFKASLWTEKRTVSQTYLEEMAIFFAKQILDITPATANYQREILLRHVEPSFYHALKKQLIEEADKYHKDNISTSFKPLSAIVNVSKMEVSLTGLLNQYVSNKFVQQTKEDYELRFVYKNGQLLIKSFILTGVQKD
ncbi:MAG TPA: type IV conjugative transfer system protein TraE [Gammaproteobacteria bacterium]|nr:type IV conjugative transfer system protein TraE [Gammaproteobacteria bacterium]